MIDVNVPDTLRRVGNNYSVVGDIAVRPESQNVSRGQAVAATLQVGLLYFAVAVPLVMLRENFEANTFLLVLSFWGSLCFFILWRRIDWSGYRFLSFGALFLITSACFRLASFFDVLIFGNRIWNWPFYANDPLLSIAYGELTFVVGAFVLVGTWLAFRGHQRSIAIIKNWRYDRPTLVVAYVMGVGVVFSVRVLDLDLGFLGSILYVFFLMSMLSILLISLGSSQRQTWKRCVLLPSLLSFPLLYGALGTGMKENIIFSVLPVAIGVFVVVKGAWKRTLVGLMMVIVLALTTVFVNIQRESNWSEKQRLSEGQVFDLSVDAFRLDNTLWKTALENLLSRKNFLEMNAWSFAIVENVGHFEEFSPIYAYQLFIPRFLWDEKPEFRPGSDFSNIALGGEAGNYTATAAGFFSAMYLSSGLWGVLVYSILIGGLYALSLSVAIRFGSSFAQILLLSGSLYKALRLDEGWPSFEFSGSISLLLIVILVGNLISSIRKRDHAHFFRIR